MPHKHNDSRRHKFEKAKYRVMNWSDYNDALRKRSDIMVWFTDGAMGAWVPDRVPGQKGRPVEYSELAIDDQHQILASDLTEKSVGDTSALDGLLDQVDAFDTFMADGAKVQRLQNHMGCPVAVWRALKRRSRGIARRRNCRKR